MSEVLIALVVFACFVAAAIGSLFLCRNLPERHRNDATHSVVKISAGIFVLMASLVLGLLVNSVKNTFETADKTLHAFATELILLDRGLRLYGPDVAEARQRLTAYTQQALDRTWPAAGAPVIADASAEKMLDGIEDYLRTVTPRDTQHIELLARAHQRLQKVIELRWQLISASRSTVYTPLFVMLVVWLTLIFASVGFNAPFNPIVVVTMLLSAFVISFSLYIVLDLDLPYEGPVRVSPAPLQQALDYMRK